MFVVKLVNNLKIFERPFITTSITESVVKKASTTQILEPVPLAYATYESTESPAENEPSPLMIVHGLFGSKGNWNSLCKVYHQKTVPKRKVIAVDARNHGDSPHSEHHTYEHLALDLKSLLHHLYIKKVTLLGHSMGGRAVMLFALRYPELIDKLIVADISPVIGGSSMKTIPQLFSAMKSVSLPKNIAMSSARMNVDQQLCRLVLDKGLRSFLLTNLVQKPDGRYAWRMNIDVLESSYDRMSSFPTVANATYKGPVLFVGGGASNFLQKSHHPEILKLFPGAKFAYIEGAGHFLHSEKPSEFLQITLDFLNSQKEES